MDAFENRHRIYIVNEICDDYFLLLSKENLEREVKLMFPREM
jgi:hypothetical protein